MDYDKLIAPAAEAMRPSGIRKFFDLAAEMPECISLGVGEPDFKTPWAVREAGIESLEHGRTRYTSNAGLKELRAEVAKYLERRMGLHYDPLHEVLITVGGSEAIDMCIRTLVQPGDEVIIPEPCFVCYEPITTLSGGVPVHVACRQEDEFRLRADALKAAITPRTKAIIICTPNNPTGAVYSEESLRQLAALAVEHDFFIVADEIYEKLVYGGAKHFSVASISREVRDHVITVNGFSKSYAMTGWRIGYAAARADIIKGIMKVQSQTTSATSAISQKAAVAALQGPQYDLHDMVKEFARRKEYMVKRLNAVPGIVCPDAMGAFYLYPDVQEYLGKSVGERKIENAMDLCQYLLDEALVSTVPGEAYNVAGKIRISYSNSMKNLEEGMDRIEKALAALQ